MRLMFVYWRIGNAGSAQDILSYAEAAQTLGHEILMYAPAEPGSPFPCSLDINSADAVILVLEWNLYLYPGGDKKKDRVVRTGLMGIGHLNVVKLLSRIPRERRGILHCVGVYKHAIQGEGEFNHAGAAASRRRLGRFDTLLPKNFSPPS